jgi:hypothetical protein
MSYCYTSISNTSIYGVRKLALTLALSRGERERSY